MAANFDAINTQLARLTGYQQAISGVNKYQRGEAARRFAAQHGIATPSGAVDDQGRFYDPNAGHWYSDPRVLGPAAVAAATGGLSLLAAPVAAGAAAGGAAAGGAAAGGVGGVSTAGLFAPTGLVGTSAAGAGTAGASAGLSSPVLGLIGALTNTGTSLIGAKMASKAGRDAAAIQDRYLRDALDYTKQQDALDRGQYAEERNRLWGLEDARQTRLEPFRNYGGGGRSLAALMTGPPVGPAGSTRGKLSDLLRA